jgi:acetyl esterase/lipase
MSWLFLIVSLIGAWFTVNTIRPVVRWPRMSIVSFLAGWLTAELALHHLGWQIAATVFFVWAGALSGWPGVVALAITLASWAGLLYAHRLAGRAEDVVERALGEALGAEYRDDIRPVIRERFTTRVDRRPLVLPFPMRHPAVERVRDIVYCEPGGIPLKLDVYRNRERPRGCPTLLQVHGGAWIIGSKNEQGIPLMLHLASRGWVCVSIDYRLSPRATFPEHIIDVKRAIEWIRTHGEEYGADPGFVVVTGGSAGGHLAALTALTANDPEYQPGFESVDTTVQGCVAFYGVYDFTDRHELWPHQGLRRLLERRVMKSRFATARDVWERASPMCRVGSEVPPFFVIHGDRDTLVPVAEARRFAATLRAAGGGPVAYAEIPGAQHAFEIFPSLRTALVVHGVERFLAWVYSRHLGLQPAIERRAGQAQA